MIQTFHKLSVELMEMYSPPRVSEKGPEVWTRFGPPNWMGFQEIRPQAESKGVPERTQAAVHHRKLDVCHVLQSSESVAME